VNILITNFHQQEAVMMDDIVESLRKIPNNHLEGLKEILFDPKRLLQKNFFGFVPRKRRAVIGEYSKSLRSIIVYSFGDSVQFFHTLFHEMGHYVYFHRLDSKVRKQWVTEIFNKETTVSSYAKLNAAEGFAECYSLYVNNRKKFSALHKQEYHFFQELVFRNFMAEGEGKKFKVLV